MPNIDDDDDDGHNTGHIRDYLPIWQSPDRCKTPSQPSQPITWLILTKLNMTATKNTQKKPIVNNHARKLLTYAQTKPGETKAWFRGLLCHQDRKHNHNCFPFGELEETTTTSSNYIDGDYPARPEIKQSLPGSGDNCGSESSTLETDVCVWRYAPLVVHATQDEEEGQETDRAYNTAPRACIRAWHMY